MAKVEGLFGGPVFVDGVDDARAKGISGTDRAADFGRIDGLGGGPECGLVEPKSKGCGVQDHGLDALRLQNCGGFQQAGAIISGMP